MKKLTKIIALSVLFLLASCGSNVEKSRLCFDKGVDYLYHSQFEEAIEQFNKAIEYDNNNHEAYFHRGCAKYNNYQKDAAAADARRYGLDAQGSPATLCHKHRHSQWRW